MHLYVDPVSIEMHYEQDESLGLKLQWNRYSVTSSVFSKQYWL